MEDKTLISKSNTKKKKIKATTIKGHKKAQRLEERRRWRRMELKDHKDVRLLSGSTYTDISFAGDGKTVQVSEWVRAEDNRPVRREMYFNQEEANKNRKPVQDRWFVEMDEQEMEDLGNYAEKKQESNVMSEETNVVTESGNDFPYSMQELHRKSGVSVLTLRKYMKRYSEEIPHSTNAKGNFSFNDAAVEAVRTIKERNTTSS